FICENPCSIPFAFTLGNKRLTASADRAEYACSNARNVARIPGSSFTGTGRAGAGCEGAGAGGGGACCGGVWTGGRGWAMGGGGSGGRVTGAGVCGVCVGAAGGGVGGTAATLPCSVAFVNRSAASQDDFNDSTGPLVRARRADSCCLATASRYKGLFVKP